jgi:endonuclease/exonuclease/phosphatase family metal-dependent hydrolase
MAAFTVRKIIKNVLIVLSVFLILAFLVSCLIPYLNPDKWWFVGFLGLAVPYLAVAMAFNVLFWLITKPKIALFPLVALLIGFQQIKTIWAWHYNAKPVLKQDNNLRILTWNVRSFNTMSVTPERKKHSAEEVSDLILQQEADIICLQEFNNSFNGDSANNHIAPFLSKYPYYFFSRDFYRSNGYTAGSIIFSKHPLLDSGRVKYPGSLSESLLYVDVRRGDDTVRFYTTHLQSFRFNEGDYSNIEKVKETGEESIAASKSLFPKMRLAFKKRGIQAKIVREQLDKSPYPFVICGDFNDVPNSFTYFHIKGNNLQDAFLKKGSGIGKTYYSIAPTLRIDYLLADKRLNVERFAMVDEGLSDHVMLVGDFSVKRLPGNSK